MTDTVNPLDPEALAERQRFLDKDDLGRLEVLLTQWAIDHFTSEPTPAAEARAAESRRKFEQARDGLVGKMRSQAEELRKAKTRIAELEAKQRRCTCQLGAAPGPEPGGDDDGVEHTPGMMWPFVQ